MINRIDASSEQFLSNLERTRARLEKAQGQISSGLRVSSVSDDPDRLNSILETDAELKRVQQAGYNLSTAKAEVDTGEQTVASVVTLLDRAKAIALSGATTLRTASERSAMAEETRGILEDLVTLANTTQAGRYLFSGDAESTPPYQVDLTQANGVTAYAGAPATRRVEDASGVSFPISVTAQDIFDAPGDSNVFAAVNQLRAALAANDEAGVAAAGIALGSAQSHVAIQLNTFGNAQNAVNRSIDAAQKREVSLKTALSKLTDADIVDATVQFQSANLQQQAALGARSMLPRKSLFDYLA